ncbi:MAG: hypothetical protein V4563_10150 [Pseudomonadota bacterium]
MKSEILRKAFWLSTLMAFVMFGLQIANAAPFAPSASEIAALPPYCKAKLSPDPTDDKLYSDRIGPDWLHIHHYCFGLNFANRFYRDYGNRIAQADDFKEAINNYDYVLDHATPDFWMRAEIGTQKARLLAAVKNNAGAISALDVALKANPDYAPAYALQSDIYRDMGQKSKALNSVEQGLQRSPLDKSLQRRYRQLAGKAFVPPVNAESVASKKSSDATPSDTAVTSAPVESTGESVSEPVPAKIGVPGNPYCRFCP